MNGDVIEFDAALRTIDTKWIDTPTSRQILHLLQCCQSEGTLGIVRGGFGIGKSHCFGHYAGRHERDVLFVTLDPTAGSLTAGLGAIAEIAGRLAPWSGLHGAAERLISYRHFAVFRALQRFFEDLHDNGLRPLLIVDEAQHARPDLLDALRDFSDRQLCGLVIGGNYRLFDPRRGRGRDADFGALQSRAVHFLELPHPTDADISAVLNAYGVRGGGAHALLQDRAATGGLREIINIIRKARLLSRGGTVGDREIKAAAATTGSGGRSVTRRGRSK